MLTTGLIVLFLSFFPRRKKALLRLKKMSSHKDPVSSPKSRVLSQIGKYSSELSSRIGKIILGKQKKIIALIKDKLPELEIDENKLCGTIFICALISGLAVLLILKVTPAGIFLSSGASFLGGIIPIINLKRKSERLNEQMLTALPHTSDLLHSFILGGHNIDQAFRSAAELSPEPLKSVLMRAVAEIQMGVARSTAFERIEKRYKIPELSFLLRFIADSEERGYPLSYALGVISQQIRAVTRDQLKSRVAKAPLKMLAPLVFLILPASVILTVGPTVLLVLDKGF